MCSGCNTTEDRLKKERVSQMSLCTEDEMPRSSGRKGIHDTRMRGGVESQASKLYLQP